MTKEDKHFYSPGDVVQVRHNLTFDCPLMVVKDIKTTLIHLKEDDPRLKYGGKRKTKKVTWIIFFWFDADGVYNEKDFNTKDLKPISNEGEFDKT